MAVTADGRRVYFSTSPQRYYYYGSAPSLPPPGGAHSPGAPAPPRERPQTLIAVIARPALPQAPAPGRDGGAAADLVAAK